MTQWLAVRSALEIGLLLSRLTGDPAVGLVLMEAALTANPEVTTEYITARLDGLLSEDTVRRRLDKMHKDGVVTCRKAGRTHHYRLRPDIVDTVINR